MRRTAGVVGSLLAIVVCLAPLAAAQDRSPVPGSPFSPVIERAAVLNVMTAAADWQLGHHVAEIAEARDVTDADSLERLYERIGYSSGREHAFETRRALLVQLQVGQELLASADSIRYGAGRSPSGGRVGGRRSSDA